MSHLILKGEQRLNMEGIPMKSLLLTTAIAVLLSMPATAATRPSSPAEAGTSA